jgi:hypothetical protein
MLRPIHDRQLVFFSFPLPLIHIYSPKSHSIVINVVSVEWVVSNPSDIVTNVVCAYPWRSTIHINASRTSIRTIVPFVEKTCSHHVNHLKTYPVDMPSMRIVSGNSPDLIIGVRFVRKLS